MRSPQRGSLLTRASRVKMLMRSPSHFNTFTDDEPAVSITALPCTQIVFVHQRRLHPHHRLWSDGVLSHSRSVLMPAITAEDLDGAGQLPWRLRPGKGERSQDNNRRGDIGRRILRESDQRVFESACTLLVGQRLRTRIR